MAKPKRIGILQNIRSLDALKCLSPGAAPARGTPRRGYSLAAAGAAAYFFVFLFLCVFSVGVWASG